MKRFLAPFVLGFCALFSASDAAAQGASGFHFGIFGGGTVPQGDAEDVFDNGWHGGGLLVFNIPVIPVGLRVDAAYHKLDSADPEISTGDAEILAATADVTVGFRLLVFKPYVVGGVGYYRLDFSDESFPSAFSGTDNETGWNAGAGVSFSLRKIDVFVEARYHSVATDGERFKFVPVSIGIAF